MTSPTGGKRNPAQRASKAVAAARAKEVALPPTTPITLIVGTDTDAGKTWVTCALARALIAVGQKVIAVKPFETGCIGGRKEDGELLAEATGQQEPKRALVRLKAPLAVPVAADLEGRTIDYEATLNQVRSYSRPDTLLLVEGVGGLLAPVTWHDNALDMAHSLNARVLLVAADRLGTINHTLLTLRILRAEKVPVLGVVLDQTSQPDESTRTNAAAIARLTDNTLVIHVPHLDQALHAPEAVKEVAGWLL